MPKPKKDFVKNAYWERNMLALLIASTTEGSGWYYDEKVTGKNSRVISIDNGTITFHVPDDFDLSGLPQIINDWDGHTNTEKWERIRKHIRKRSCKIEL